MKKEPSQPAAQDADDSRSDAVEREVLSDFESAADAEAQTRRLIAERDEGVANWKRAQADYQNLRRRLQSDIDSALQRSKQTLLQELLLVVDYLEMALATPVKTDEGRNLLAGVELTRTALLRALERENVRAVPESGLFDPAFHQAVESVPTADEAPGTILATLRRGYAAGGQVLRPAQVRVAVAPDEPKRAARAPSHDKGGHDKTGRDEAGDDEEG